MTEHSDFIKVTNLVKRFGSFTAVDDVSFTIREGEIFGLLGPNGAGKSTTISMLCGLFKADAGEIAVEGKSILREPMTVKKMLGLVPQDIALYPTLNAVENLGFWGRMYGMGGAEIKKRIAEVLEIVGLNSRAKDTVEKYSGGMKRRLNIAAGILHNPRILIMDEPTVGIDPQSRNHILDTVKKLNGEGMTVIYTSHYMEEVEFLCDRVGIMDAGKLIALGTKDELRKMVGDADEINITVDNANGGLLEEIKSLPRVRDVTLNEDRLTVLSLEGNRVMAEIVAYLTEKGIKISAVSVKEPDLESVFLHLTGKALRD